MFTCGCHRGHADQGSRSTFFYVVHRTSKFWILWNYRVHLKVMWSWNTWKILKLKIFIILEFAIMLLVVKSKRPGQQNHVYDAETRLNGNPDVVMDTLFLHIMRQTLRSRLHTRCKAPHDFAVAHQRGNHSNNKLSHHLVGTQMSHWQPLSCSRFYPTQPRILDILILQDKTLSCACVDNFKQNGGFWCHCACADNFKQNVVFWRQHLPIVHVWTWPKYNKHHHDWKKQLCRFIDMYIGKIFWPTAPCRGCPEKKIWRQG